MTAIQPSRLAALVDRARREVDDELLPACSLAVGFEGEVVAHQTFGEADDQSLFHVFSATKPVVATTLMQLAGEGRIDVGAPVAAYLPEFGANGKDQVTVEQVMCHLGGFPQAPMGPADWGTQTGRVARMASWRLTYEPGNRVEYHAVSAHWVVAALIEQIEGEDFRAVVHRRVVDAVGLPTFRLGVPRDEQPGLPITTLVGVGAPPSPDDLEAVFGVRELPPNRVTEDLLLAGNTPEFNEAGVPGAGALATAADMALLYQHFLHDPRAVWKPEVLADAKQNVRTTLPDSLHGAPANRTLAFIVAGADGQSALRGQGRTVSPAAFGHNGAAGQVAWADPATGISFSYVTNGVDADFIRQARRGVALSSLAGLLTTPA